MKTRLVVFVIALVGLAGCTAPDTTNTKKNRDAFAQVESRAKNFEMKDGSLGGDYVADLLLNGRGKKSNKPLFDQPIGDQMP